MNYIKKLREVKPLVHNITNYVTVNDVANAILAIGGSPIMSDEITAVSYTHLTLPTTPMRFLQLVVVLLCQMRSQKWLR